MAQVSCCVVQDGYVTDKLDQAEATWKELQVI